MFIGFKVRFYSNGKLVHETVLSDLYEPYIKELMEKYNADKWDYSVYILD